MTVFLIRHAKAEDASPDAARRLTTAGRSHARALGKFLGRSEAFAPAVLWHSTLVRARETAELVAAGVEAFLDDRDERPGVLLADQELIGIPHRFVIGERGDDVHDDGLAGQGMGLAAHAAVGDARDA